MQIPQPPRVNSGAVEEARTILDTLSALGLRHVVFAPGSRSAPFAYAAHAQHAGLELHVRHDERAASFLALGLAKAGQASAVITTSGTAAAHLLAATMEAHHSGVPLLLITADRPAELRGTGANQTTIQPGLYGAFARTFDIPAPAAHEATEPELRTAVNTAARAFHEAVRTPGPVHLNVAFRDPLTPGTPEEERAEEGASLAVPARATAEPAPVELQIHPRTVVLVGDATPAEGAKAAALASRLHLPLLTEPSSNARIEPAPCVPAYTRALSEVLGSSEHPLYPSEVLVFGHPTLSRPVARDLLGTRGIAITVVSSRRDYPDTARRATRIIDALDAGAVRLEGKADATFASGWAELGTQLFAAARERLSPQAEVALAVWDACAREGVPLVLGASALIRDLDTLAPPAKAPGMPVYANRGLAGIDGTFATASGIALAHGRRTCVLVGDVTAIHDLTGLVIGPTEPEPPLDIVIVDDDGGRIFSSLEHAAAPADLLERFFTTPHGLDLAAAVEALGVSTVRSTPQSLASDLAKPAGEGGGRRAFVVKV